MRAIRLFAIVLALGLGLAARVSAQTSGITLPRDNAVVRGVVLVEGTATDPSFLRYELAFFKEFDPQGDWVVFATEHQPVVNGVLAVWDTTIGRDSGAPFYPDGTYRLRLRVVRQDYNYDEYYVLGISIANDLPSPTPTAIAVTATSPATLAATPSFAAPTEIPTLTPFPSPTARPPAVTGPAETAEPSPTPGRRGSPLSLEGEFDSDRVKGGICLGINLTLLFFGALAGYLLFRNSIRIVLARIRSWFSR